MTRALTVVRLSVLKDPSTSPERQQEHCINLIRARDWTPVDVAEDLDVSATKFSPFNRPNLGPWLTEPDKIAQWDVLVVWRLDRLVRSSKDLADLLAWCQENGKNFVSATEGFDLSTPFGKAMATIIAALGELEADTVSVRVADAHRALRTTDRLPSGVPPFGFVPVPHPSGRGIGYAPDPDMQEQLRRMASWFLSGWSYSRISVRLTEDGVLMAKDRSRARTGKEPLRSPWSDRAVKACLTSPATQGWKMHGGNSEGRPVLDESGAMVRVAPPTFDDETWELIQARAAERLMSGNRRTHSPNPLLGIGRCGVCGRGLTQQFNHDRKTVKAYRRYRCGRAPRVCKGVSGNADQVDALVERAFLLAYGDWHVRERVFVPGSDNRIEIESLRGSLARLRAESDAGLVDDQDDYLRRLQAISGRLRELEREPYRASGWRYEQTDQTYREAWRQADTEGRRKLLSDAGASVILHRSPRGKPSVEIELDYLALHETG